MMKFWKSAAKGKSGCPVRPPESAASCSKFETTLLLDTQLDDVEDEMHIFEKKSRLCLNLHDILVEKKCINYFIQFMESIDKEILIKCYLEMENFKALIVNAGNSQHFENHVKPNRPINNDLCCKCAQKETNYLNQFLWKNKVNKNEIINRSDDFKNSVSSTSSCLNLVEHNIILNVCNECGKQNNLNITEKAIELFKKYVAKEAQLVLEIPDSCRKTVISSICQPKGIIKDDCFKPVQETVYCQIEKQFFGDFLNSPFYIKAQVDILTSGSLTLKDILYNDTLLFYFTEYLDQESCRNLLEFLISISHFRNNLSNGNTSSSDQAQADAIVLYDKYFSLQATSPIGFPQYIRLKIESDICTEGGPHHSCFDLPYRIVFKTLSQYVKTFLETELYYKYLSEMVHSVNQMWSLNNRSQSDCSSEYSISTQNTLLAMGDPIYRKKKRNHSVPDMTIDSNQLYNADALWQRKRNDGLTLGRVNSLGRFESKFEPDPDKKSKSVLKKMVSKFVPTSTSKVEEEMAWQIAHMIVKDVTDLTMAPPESEQED
ncbi:hypothetical protein ACJJTC_004355 [Scirpophaga incertulas]